MICNSRQLMHNLGSNGINPWILPDARLAITPNAGDDRRVVREVFAGLRAGGVSFGWMDGQSHSGRAYPAG
jgi:hypothetical protein